MANMVNYVRFQRGTVEAYEALKTAGTLDNNTLYFIYEEGNENTGALYMGTRFIGGNNAGKMNLDDLADVIVAEAGTNSFLVKNAEGQWVAKSLADVVELIAANLEESAAPAQIFQVIGESNETDLEAIARVVEEDTLLTAGDIVIVKRLIANNKYQHTAYVFDNKNWVAMDGNYSAENIFTPEDIQVTTAVGELSANTIVDAGTNFAELLTKILSKSKNPTKTEPSITSFSVTNNGTGSSFEAGTSITPKWASTFNNGAYTYKSSVSNEDIVPVAGTGVAVNSWLITRDGTTIGDTEDGTGEAFIIGDDTVIFKATVDYTDGNYALTNLNKLPEKEVRIAANTIAKSANITSYRKMFAGGSTATAITSDLIRGLSGTKASTSSFEFKASVGDTKLIFAYPSTLSSAEPKFEYFTMAWESVGGFSKVEDVQVADARGGENGLMTYTVYTYAPAAPYATETKYRVSF
jgi:hypothetical protein